MRFLVEYIVLWPHYYNPSPLSTLDDLRKIALKGKGFAASTSPFVSKGRKREKVFTPAKKKKGQFPHLYASFIILVLGWIANFIYIYIYIYTFIINIAFYVIQNYLQANLPQVSILAIRYCTAFNIVAFPIIIAMRFYFITSLYYLSSFRIYILQCSI